MRTVELQNGLGAQALRHLDILLDTPLKLVIDDGSPIARELEFRGAVRGPQMGHFVIQKALIHSRRDRRDQVKDTFYVFDLIDTENGLADAVLQDVAAAARSKWGEEADRFQEVLEQRFREPAFVQAVLEQLGKPREGGPTPRYVSDEMQGWLDRLRGELVVG